MVIEPVFMYPAEASVSEVVFKRADMKYRCRAPFRAIISFPLRSELERELVLLWR